MSEREKSALPGATHTINLPLDGRPRYQKIVISAETLEQLVELLGFFAERVVVHLSETAKPRPGKSRAVRSIQDSADNDPEAALQKILKKAKRHL